MPKVASSPRATAWMCNCGISTLALPTAMIAKRRCDFATRCDSARRPSTLRQTSYGSGQAVLPNDRRGSGPAAGLGGVTHGRPSGALVDELRATPHRATRLACSPTTGAAWQCSLPTSTWLPPPLRPKLALSKLRAHLLRHDFDDARNGRCLPSNTAPHVKP